MAKSKILISAGEASGDLHGSRLASELFKLAPDSEILAMGSSKLRAAGAKILIDCQDIAVVGLFEVLRHYGKIKAALKLLQHTIDTAQIDLLILVDYVEFNLKLAAYAKARGVKVLFYISPQVWAWRSGRVPKIGAAIDHIAVIFPFETKIYQQHNIPVSYVGHPLAGNVRASMPQSRALELFGLNPHIPVVALLPGSRSFEVQTLLPIMLESAKLLAKRHQLQFVLALAPTIDKASVAPIIHECKQLDIKIIQEQTYDVLNCAKAAMVASGTATLEVALSNVPMCVLYKTNPISYAIFKRLIEIDDICLVNIISQRRVVPEFVQHEAKPSNIAQEVERQLLDLAYRQTMIAALFRVRKLLGNGGGSQKVAQLALAMLNDNAGAK